MSHLAIRVALDVDDHHTVQDPIHLKDALECLEGLRLGRTAIKALNFNAVLLSVGLAGISLTAAAMAMDGCNDIEEYGEIRDVGKYCTDKNYPYTRNGKCICPNPRYNSKLTKRCRLWENRNGVDSPFFTCGT